MSLLFLFVYVAFFSLFCLSANAYVILTYLLSFTEEIDYSSVYIHGLIYFSWFFVVFPLYKSKLRINFHVHYIHLFFSCSVFVTMMAIVYHLHYQFYFNLVFFCLCSKRYCFLFNFLCMYLIVDLIALLSVRATYVCVYINYFQHIKNFCL